MTRRERRAIGMTVAAIALMAGGAVLAVLQVQWVTRAAQAEEERQRRSLNAGAQAVGNDVLDELRVLLSLMVPRAAYARNGVADDLMQSLEIWYQTARFPDLVRGAYVSAIPPNADSLVYDREAGVFVRRTLPDSIAEIIETMEDIHEGFLTVRPVDGPRESLLLFSPVGVPAEEGDAGAALAALEIDERVIYRELVPYFMAQRLPEYPFRVVDSANGEVLAVSAEPPGLREADLEVMLEGLPLGEQNPWRMEPSRAHPGELQRALPEDPEGIDPLENPLLRLWALRSRAMLEYRRTAGLDGKPPQAVRVLQVYHPGVSLEDAARSRKILNLAVSFGILGLLLGSLVVLYRLYRRTGKLRASEQEFVASMSHELRTPISVIQAASDNLAQGVVRDHSRIPRYASVIRDQTRRLTTMLESILLYAGLESGGRQPAPVEIDPAAFLEEVVAPLRQPASEHGHTLVVEAAGLPAKACLDPMAIRLIVENLVMNAIRHADPGTVRLTVTPRTFDQLRISVEDDGPGIPLREQTRVFAPFARGERSIRNQLPGSGLGLHLVRRVVALQGGTVGLESPYTNLAEKLQTGCRFTVTLPLRGSCADG